MILFLILAPVCRTHEIALFGLFMSNVCHFNVDIYKSFGLLLFLFPSLVSLDLSLLFFLTVDDFIYSYFFFNLDLPVQWTEQSKVPISWKHQVRPLIFASLSSSSQSSSTSSSPFESLDNTIRVTLSLNTINDLLTTTNHHHLFQIELILSPQSRGQSSVHFNHHYQNQSFLTEEHGHFRWSPDQLQNQSSAEAVIRRLFTDEQQPPATSSLPEVCHLFTGQIVVQQSTDNKTDFNQEQSTTVKDNDDDDVAINQQPSSATIQLCSHGTLVSQAVTFFCNSLSGK